MPKKDKNQNQTETELAVIGENIKDIREDVNEIKHRLEGSYVTRDEFEPYKRIIQGLVALTITTVFGALLALVINRP